MKYEQTPQFVADLRKLKPEHLVSFRDTFVEKFNRACDAYAADPNPTYTQTYHHHRRRRRRKCFL